MHSHRKFAEDELEEHADCIICEFHIEDDAGRMAQRRADIGRSGIRERIVFEEKLCGRRHDFIHVAVQLLAHIGPDDVCIRQAKVRYDIFDVAGQDFFKRIHVKFFVK